MVSPGEGGHSLFYLCRSEGKKEFELHQSCYSFVYSSLIGTWILDCKELLKLTVRMSDCDKSSLFVLQLINYVLLIK